MSWTCYFRAVHNLIPLSLSHDLSSQVLLIMSDPEEVNRLGAQSSRERLLVPDTRAAFTSLSTQRCYINVCRQCRSAVLIVHCLGSVKLQQTNNKNKTSISCFLSAIVHVLIPDVSTWAAVNISVGHVFDYITSTRCSPAVSELP